MSIVMTDETAYNYYLPGNPKWFDEGVEFPTFRDADVYAQELADKHGKLIKWAESGSRDWNYNSPMD